MVACEVLYGQALRPTKLGLFALRYGQEWGARDLRGIDESTHRYICNRSGEVGELLVHQVGGTYAAPRSLHIEAKYAVAINT